MSLVTTVDTDVNLQEPTLPIKPASLLNQLTIAVPAVHINLIALGEERAFKATVQPRNIISLSVPSELINAHWKNQQEADEFSELIAALFNGYCESGSTNGYNWEFTLISETDTEAAQGVAAQILEWFPTITLTVCNPSLTLD